MFYRGNIQRRKLLKPKPLKKKKLLNQPMWDSTVQDLTVHAASPEEQLRRQLRRKSKNADLAHKEMIAKKRGIPVDLVLSPGQVELEMKKLAILREVLYDQNDFNEVLRKTDQTMASVTNLFHDSVARKSGHPNITLAPGSKLPPPVNPDPEQPSKLDALSDSVMDNKALNEQSSDESEYEDDVQFESKVDYDRFMSLLKDKMNNKKAQPRNQQDVTHTPERGPPAPSSGALNCTEEVKRTLSRISSIRDEDGSDLKNEQKRKIDQVIHGISSIRKDASKLERDLNTSKAAVASVLPVPNHTQRNLSYDELQGAMANVQNQLKAFEARTGRLADQIPPQSNQGLAGFTVTLIDSVTRLTTYVNEGELRAQTLEKSLNDLRSKFLDQMKVTEALALELVNTQRVIEKDQEDLSSLRRELKELKENTSEEWRGEMEEKVGKLSEEVKELENKLVISENTIVEGGDALMVDEMVLANNQKEPVNDQKEPHIKNPDVHFASMNKLKEEEELALKSDMVMLLNALKTQNAKVAHPLSAPSLPTMMDGGQALSTLTDGGQEAARTIASVESHLRHLQLQHAEAQQRMDELTKQAQMHTTSNQASVVSPSLSSEASSLASLPVRIPPGSKAVMQQTNFMLDGSAYSIPPCFESVKPDKFSIPPYSESIETDKLQIASDFPEFESESGSFKFLEEDAASSQSELSSLLSSPHIAEQQQAVLNSIHRSQMSLEDRISELNNQHSQAQERLQKLVVRRKSEKPRDQPAKRVQISLPSADMMQTPQQRGTSRALQ